MPTIYLEPYKSWQERQTRPGYDITWKCDAGWLFARVWDRIVTRYHFDLYGMLVANVVPWGSGVPPSPGSSFPITILQDNNVPPRRILRHENEKMLWEVFPSLNHPTTLMFLRTPQSQQRGGMTNEIGTWNPQFTDPFGFWFEGKDSDIDYPTEAGRFFIPPFRDTEIGLVNQENYAIRPQSLFIINQLHLSPFDPSTEYGKKMIAKILSNPGRATMGTPGAEPYHYTRQEFTKWFGVEPVLWDGKSAQYKSGDTIMDLAEVE